MDIEMDFEEQENTIINDFLKHVAMDKDERSDFRQYFLDAAEGRSSKMIHEWTFNGKTYTGTFDEVVEEVFGVENYAEAKKDIRSCEVETRHGMLSWTEYRRGPADEPDEDSFHGREER